LLGVIWYTYCVWILIWKIISVKYTWYGLSNKGFYYTFRWLHYFRTIFYYSHYFCDRNIITIFILFKSKMLCRIYIMNTNKVTKFVLIFICYQKAQYFLFIGPAGKVNDTFSLLGPVFSIYTRHGVTEIISLL